MRETKVDNVWKRQKSVYIGQKAWNKNYEYLKKVWKKMAGVMEKVEKCVTVVVKRVINAKYLDKSKGI